MGETRLVTAKVAELDQIVQKNRVLRSGQIIESEFIYITSWYFIFEVTCGVRRKPWYPKRDSVASCLIRVILDSLTGECLLVKSDFELYKEDDGVQPYRVIGASFDRNKHLAIVEDIALKETIRSFTNVLDFKLNKITRVFRPAWRITYQYKGIREDVFYADKYVKV